MLGNAATTVPAIRDGLQKHGVAEGGRKMIDEEMLAAQLAIKSGVYITWRSKRNQQDCARIGYKSRCFCGHQYSDHKMKNRLPSCFKCKCKCFEYIPKRPEEVGDWWLVRRRGFNVHTWRAKCRCGCPHNAHDPVTKSCNSCSCAHFTSNFLCLSCDGKFEEHVTTFESGAERKRDGRTFGMAFKPLSEYRDIQQNVFNASSSNNKSMKMLSNTSNGSDGMSPEEMYSSGMIDSNQYFQLIANNSNNDDNNDGRNNRAVAAARNNTMRRMQQQQRQQPITRPYNKRAERSVRLMHVSSGGQNTGKIVNRWGKTDTSGHLLTDGDNNNTGRSNTHKRIENTFNVRAVNNRRRRK